jgi:Cu-Zn family superoxide dismutase
MKNALALLAAGLVACGGSTKKQTTPPATAPASSAASSAAAHDPEGRMPPPAPVKEQMASAKLESRSGSKITGTADFVEKDGATTVTITVAGAAPGDHGIHVHETGDCSAPDAKSAGGHFNPENMQHGAPNMPPHHSGDLGNITVGADGTGKAVITTKDLTVAAGPHSVVGKSVVVHAAADDLKGQPAGNSGARAACGVVAVSDTTK